MQPHFLWADVVVSVIAQIIPSKDKLNNLVVERDGVQMDANVWKGLTRTSRVEYYTRATVVDPVHITPLCATNRHAVHLVQDPVDHAHDLRQEFRVVRLLRHGIKVRNCALKLERDPRHRRIEHANRPAQSRNQVGVEHRILVKDAFKSTQRHKPRGNVVRLKRVRLIARHKVDTLSVQHGGRIHGILELRPLLELNLGQRCCNRIVLHDFLQVEERLNDAMRAIRSNKVRGNYARIRDPKYGSNFVLFQLHSEWISNVDLPRRRPNLVHLLVGHIGCGCNVNPSNRLNLAPSLAECRRSDLCVVRHNKLVNGRAGSGYLINEQINKVPGRLVRNAHVLDPQAIIS